MNRRLMAIAVMLLAGALLISFLAAKEANPGIIVSAVGKDSGGELAGLHEGDIVQNWARGEAHGEIQSPFDLSAVEIEQAPRGTVTLQGLRGNELRAWTLERAKWGITTQPPMPEPVLGLYRQGQEMAKTDKFADAAATWEKAAAQLTDSKVTWLLYQTANMWAGARRWEEADQAYREAVESAAGAEPVIATQLFLSWGDLYRSRSDWKNAEACYRRSILEYEKLGSEGLTIATSLSDLGTVSHRRGDLAKAAEYHRQALKIRQRLAPGSLDVAASFNNLGIVNWNRGDLTSAEDFLQKALDIREKLVPGSLDLAWTINGLGLVAWNRGDLAKAEEYHLRALEIRQKLAPGSMDVAASFNNLGALASDQGNLAKAHEYYRAALEIREKLAAGSIDHATSFNNLGIVAFKQGDLVKAEEYYRRALEIGQKLAPISVDVADYLNNLGQVALNRGDLAAAKRYYHRALLVQEKLAPGSLDVAASINNLGVVAGNEGRSGKAEEYYRQALKIRQRMAPGSLDVAESLNNLGEVAANRKDSIHAEEYYRQALAILQKLAPESMSTATVYNNLGEIAGGRNNFAKAEEYYSRAEAIRGNLAPESNEHAESLASLAGILQRTGQADSAAELYERAVKAFESQTARLGGAEEVRSNFRAGHSKYFVDYIDLLMQQRKPDVAFHLAERWRARSVLETLAEAHVDVRQGVDPDLRTRELYLQQTLKARSTRRIMLLTEEHTEKQIAEVERDIAELRNQYDELQERIRANSPVYASLTYPKPLTAQETQRLLDDHTLLLEYALGEKRSYLWSITSNSLTSHELPPAQKIEALARRVYKLISTPGGGNSSRTKEKPELSASRNLSAVLSRMVLGPVAGEIRGKRLLIVADGALQYIPFDALPVPGATGDMPLVTEHEIVSAPSASVVAELRREAGARKPAPKAVAVLADPVFDAQDPRVVGTSSRKGGKRDKPPAQQTILQAQERVTRSAADVGLLQLPRLAFSRREADAIMALTPPGQGLEALGFAANRSIATSQELAEYRVVHFATHALSNNRDPKLSGLVLSLVDRQGQPQNGFLELGDIYNLHLSAELVVLSACETALGRQIKGEGLVGLTRGFMYAGATEVMSSLWNVDDVATKELMERFYRSVEQQGMRPAAALRMAQIAMWKQPRWRDPYYWAAFQIQGEWK